MKQILTRINEELYNKIVSEATRENRSISNYVNLILKEKLEENGWPCSPNMVGKTSASLY